MALDYEVPHDKRLWERKAASGDPEAQQLLKMARSAKVREE